MKFFKDLLGSNHGRGSHSGGKHHDRGHGSARHERRDDPQNCESRNHSIDGTPPAAQSSIKAPQNCRQCRTTNEPSARFCLNCGVPLTNGCSACGSPMSAGARFCSQCGQAAL
ncbi:MULTISPECIES: zinc ribbon domain-containing protein [Pseudomonas]|uniref:Zinc ribbon domain-containing protein n=2 Tax=Pseudomonas TaxID=286 RepID=A0A7K4EH88_9PSED|nr:zinc ribbon domain-containing protein [Pseudomonas bharatica CSV86]